MSSDSPYGKALEKAKSHTPSSTPRDSRNSRDEAPRKPRENRGESSGSPYGNSAPRPRNDRPDRDSRPTAKRTVLVAKPKTKANLEAVDILLRLEFWTHWRLSRKKWFRVGKP